MWIFTRTLFLSTSAILTHHPFTLHGIVAGHDRAGCSWEADRELHSGVATPFLCHIDRAPHQAALMRSRGPASYLPLSSLLPLSLWRKHPSIEQVLLSISDPIAHVHSFSYADFTAGLLYIHIFELIFLFVICNVSFAHCDWFWYSQRTKDSQCCVNQGNIR